MAIVAIGQNDSHSQDYMSQDYEGEQAFKAWDLSIGQVVQELKDEKITQYHFKRGGSGTPGHLRISEAQEMADELAAYISKFEIGGWS